MRDIKIRIDDKGAAIVGCDSTHQTLYVIYVIYI